MNKEAQKKINNNNRKRGGAFEKRVADYLGFDVVPYSGSNARFGYCLLYTSDAADEL